MSSAAWGPAPPPAWKLCESWTWSSVSAPGTRWGFRSDPAHCPARACYPRPSQLVLEGQERDVDPGVYAGAMSGPLWGAPAPGCGKQTQGVCCAHSQHLEGGGIVTPICRPGPWSPGR